MSSIINATTTAGVSVAGDNSGSLQLATNNGTTAVTIDTSQNVGIGTASPASKLDINGGGSTAKINTLDTFDGGASLSTWMKVGRRAGTGNNSYINTSHNGSDAVDALTFAFGTSGTGTERMRLTDGGFLLIGTTSAVDSEKLNVTQTGQFTAVYSNSTNATNAYGIRQNMSNYFFNTNSFFFDGIEFSNVRFRVYSNGGIANYQANDQNLSDQREKKNIELAPNYLDKICQIPVKTFLYINQTDTQKTLGVIAQDVQAIAPELVDEADWSENVDGSKMRLSIYQTDLQYALMKSIQELKAELDATKAEVQALKGVA